MDLYSSESAPRGQVKVERKKGSSSILISLTSYPSFTPIFLAFPLLTLFSPIPLNLHILKGSNSSSVLPKDNISVQSFSYSLHADDSKI